MRRLLLVSNRVMHYRVSVYNYFSRRFRQHGWEFVVRSNELQSRDTCPLAFDFREIRFAFHKYRKEIEKIRPDVVIVFLHLKDPIIWPLVHWLKSKRIPVVFWSKGANLDRPHSKLRHLFFDYMHSQCDRIILYSEHEVRYVRERDRHKVSIASNTINFEAFPQILERKQQIKEDLGIPFEKVVLFAGRMGIGGERKKVHHLIEVFRDMGNRGIGLVIVGSGMSSDLLKRANPHNTVYLGEVHDPQHIQISRIFKMADVFCIPGHVGLGLNQAFYWGLPVITEDGGQPPEIHYLINGRNGFIVPNDDLIELKGKILYLLENDEVRQEFSRNAREDILRNASVANMFMGFKNCVDSLPKLRET